MATYVLIGGAWLGGWAWDDVAGPLRAAGHFVHAHTQPGLSERTAEGPRDTDLDSYIGDVVGRFERNSLQGVILVGHSYSGIVISGVADRIPERIASLVFCDSAPFVDGEAYLDVVGGEAADSTRTMVAEQVTAGSCRRRHSSRSAPACKASIRPERMPFAPRMTPQPFATWTQPLRLEGNEGTYPRVVIACDNLKEFVRMGIPRMVELTREPWTWIELDTGHWPMFSAAEALTRALDGLVVTAARLDESTPKGAR